MLKGEGPMKIRLASSRGNVVLTLIQERLSVPDLCRGIFQWGYKPDSTGY